MKTEIAREGEREKERARERESKKLSLVKTFQKLLFMYKFNDSLCACLMLVVNVRYMDLYLMCNVYWI